MMRLARPDTPMFAGLTAALTAVAVLCVIAAWAEPVNLLPNPSFERVEPPVPRAGVTVTAEDWVPTTWDMRGDWGATVTCPDDPAQAHSGRRCVRLKADQGVGHIIYGPLPCPDARPWTIRLWARGSGTLLVQGIEYLPDRWERLPDMPPVQVSDAWTQYELHVTPQAERRQWWLDIATQGKSDVWVDDVFAGYEGAASLGLPPDKPVGKDDSTLLYLDFEQPLDEDAFYIGGKAGLSADNEGRFGKCLNLGADGYVACSANENVDPAQGTIEVWCKFLTPGNDVVLRPIVSIPGPEGMSLHKDQYSHISFGFSSGWATLSNATALGYADRWQPGVWRHFAACWDKDLMQVFVDGKLVAWCDKPKLSRSLGPELRIGGPDMQIADLRISKIVRYRQAVPPLAAR